MRSSLKLLITCIVIYFVLWTVLPLLLTTSYPLDVNENLAWGSEWQFGYYKHPPFTTWVLHIFSVLFGSIAPYLLSQICVILALVLIYALAKQFYTKEKAILAACLSLGTFYFTIPTIEFNHNVAQMPVWIGLIYLFYLIITKGFWRYWLAFGVLAGIGMLVKYSVAVLLVSIIIYSLITQYRNLWLSAKAWCAIAIAVIIFSPNLYWLSQHDWLSLYYFEGRSESKTGIFNIVQYVLSQLINLIPLLLILLLSKLYPINKPDRRYSFLLFFAIVPSLLLVVLAAIFGIGLRAMWGMPMWTLSSLLFFVFIPDFRFEQYKNRLVKILIGWLVLVTIAIAVILGISVKIKHKPSRVDWPQQALALQMNEIWQTHSKCSLSYVGGDNWLATLVANGLDQPISTLISPDPRYSPWIKEPDLSEKGIMLLDQNNQVSEVPYSDFLEHNVHLISYTGSMTLPWTRISPEKSLVINWRLFIPEQCVKPYE